MPRKVLAFVPQHTTTKSRIMAIVDKDSGLELDAIATVDWPYEASALCNILNADNGSEILSGLWHTLPSSVKANLEKAKSEKADAAAEGYDLASLFIAELEAPEEPAPYDSIKWSELFSATQRPPQGCDMCNGCPGHAQVGRGEQPVNQCAPGGTCECQSENLDDCPCSLWDVGPRWAAALYESLTGIAEVLVTHAEEKMWGIDGPAVGFPESLAAQAPAFYLRLARTCADLCGEFASGRVPVPHTIAELIMLDEAARSYLSSWIGKDGLDIEAMKERLSHLPEAHGDFELDALWMFQFTESDWIDIIEADTMFEPYSMDRIFEPLPEAKDWPRPA